MPAGAYRGLLETEDTPRWSPAGCERKFYARGVGLVEQETVAGRRASGVELTGVRAP